MTVEGEFNEMAEKLRQLPPDWWQTAAASIALLQFFRDHVIALLVVGVVGSKTQYSVYTGFFVRHKETVIWVTAGHVVDELIHLLSSPNFKPSTMTWLDNFHIEGAEGVRLHRTDIPMKSWKAEGLDLGIVLPSLLDLGNLLKKRQS